MDLSFIFDFLGDHFGEILLGLELFILNLFGKGKLTEEEKEQLKAKKIARKEQLKARRKAKKIARKEEKALKTLEKVKSTMQDVENMKKE